MIDIKFNNLKKVSISCYSVARNSLLKKQINNEEDMKKTVAAQKNCIFDQQPVMISRAEPFFDDYLLIIAN
jgi:hypothetical protein